MKYHIIAYISIFQIIVIVGLVLYVFNKSQNKSYSLQKVQGEVHSSESGDLKFFFEPLANAVQKDDLSWMGKNYNYSVAYTINSDTLNQTGEIEVVKPKNTFRIITLGTSYTFGSFVNTGENFSSNLEQILNSTCPNEYRYEVINLGVAGYDINYSVNRFLTRGEKYDADVLIWFFTEPDFLRFTDMLLPIVNSILQEKHISSEKEQKIENGVYYPIWKEANKKVIIKLGGEKALQKQRKYIKELLSNYRNPVVFAGQQLRDKYKNLLQSIVVNNQPKVYFDNDIINFYDTKYELPDHHPNREGHKIIAQDLFKYLSENELIPCKL